MQYGYFILLAILTVCVMVLLFCMRPKLTSSGDGAHQHPVKLKHDHNSGVMSIDYYAYISQIRDWNPMFKVFFSLLVLILVIILNSIYVSIFVILVMGVITVVYGRIPLEQYIDTMKIPLVFVIVGSLTIALNFSAKPAGQYNLSCFGLFYIYTSDAELFKMANLMLKALAAVSALFMMTLSTPSGEIVSVLRKVHVPKLFLELMNMIYRYIFVIMETNRKMHDSAESRLGYKDYKTSLKSFAGTASNLLVVSLKKANAYYDALESRGYTGELLFLEKDKPFDRKQMTIGIVILLCIAILFAVQKMQVFG